MRGYATSRFRIFVLLIAVGAAAVVVSSRVDAQDAGAPPATAPAASRTPAVPAPQTAAPGGAAGQELRRTNPFALLWRPDTLTDFVFWTIMFCSVAGLTLIIQGFIRYRKSVLIPEAANNRIRELIASRQFKELVDFTAKDPSFVSKVLHPALRRAPRFSAMREAMETALNEQTAEEFRRIEYLNILGNLGPLLGLLGTVLGMIDAFQSLHAASGNANPALLSGGISLALTHTMLGLMLAIPCLAAFGILRTKADRLTVEGSLTAEELLLMLAPAEERGTAAPSAASPRPAVTIPAASRRGAATASAPAVADPRAVNPEP
jgi:biopolymer transport protein ExbB